MAGEKFYKLLWMDDIDFWKIDLLENVKVVVACNNIISMSDDSAINKLIVIQISSDKIKTVSWVNKNNKRGNRQKI